jgi:hypothetical protein
VSAQEIAVYVVIALAVLYVVRRFFGPRRRPKRSSKPDVPLSRLKRKKK